MMTQNTFADKGGLYHGQWPGSCHFATREAVPSRPRCYQLQANSSSDYSASVDVDLGEMDCTLLAGLFALPRVTLGGASADVFCTEEVGVEMDSG